LQGCPKSLWQHGFSSPKIGFYLWTSSLAGSPALTLSLLIMGGNSTVDFSCPNWHSTGVPQFQISPFLSPSLSHTLLPRLQEGRAKILAIETFWFCSKNGGKDISVWRKSPKENGREQEKNGSPQSPQAFSSSSNFHPYQILSGY
jgi:hypothetical protein